MGRSGRQHPGVVHRVGGDREQVDRLLLERALLVEPGEQQQVLDEQAHPGGLVLDPPHHPVQALGSRTAPCR